MMLHLKLKVQEDKVANFVYINFNMLRLVQYTPQAIELVINGFNSVILVDNEEKPKVEAAIKQASSYITFNTPVSTVALNLNNIPFIIVDGVKDQILAPLSINLDQLGVVPINKLDLREAMTKAYGKSTLPIPDTGNKPN